MTHSGVAILPFSLSAERSMTYSKHPTTIGEHILKRRCELELFQKNTAKRFNVSISTLIGWEKGYSNPGIRHYPVILSFLEYDPFPEPKTLGERIVSWRRWHGLSRKQLARQLGIDEAALAKREKDETSSTDKKAAELTELLTRKFGNGP